MNLITNNFIINETVEYTNSSESSIPKRGVVVAGNDIYKTVSILDPLGNVIKISQDLVKKYDFEPGMIVYDIETGIRFIIISRYNNGNNYLIRSEANGELVDKECQHNEIVLPEFYDALKRYVEELEAELSKQKTSNNTDTNSHYCLSKVQPIEYIQDILKDWKGTSFQSACTKDLFKYLSRYGHKDDKKKEAKKILDYALWFVLDAYDVKIDPRYHNHETVFEMFSIKEKGDAK